MNGSRGFLRGDVRWSVTNPIIIIRLKTSNSISFKLYKAPTPFKHNKKIHQEHINQHHIAQETYHQCPQKVNKEKEILT